LSEHTVQYDYPPQRKPPELPQFDPLLKDCEEEALKELILDIRLLVLFDLQFGHSGLLMLGSEKRTSLSNSEPQFEQMYS